ncbi:MAG: hypothetical protein JXR05_14390 [Flavobacteriaceae bacterium]
MGFFDFLNSKPSDEKLIKKLMNFVYNSVQSEKGVRVEDALCLISTIVAERCIKLANNFSIYEHDFEPGSAVFSDQVNEILAGPIFTENWEDLPNESVFGKIRVRLEAKFQIKDFPSLKSVFENYPKNIGEPEWGNLDLSIPEEHRPFLLPLRAGYESRKYFDKNIHIESDEKSLQIAIYALTNILTQTKQALTPLISLTMVFELINGMSKTATMTDKKMKELMKEINQ